MAYTKKQLAEFAAEYDRLRNNLLRRTRDWLEKGYEIEEFEKPKTSRELLKEGKTVAKSAIKELRKLSEQVKSGTTHEYTDTATGDTTQLPIREYQRRHKSEAGKRGYENYKKRKQEEDEREWTKWVEENKIWQDGGIIDEPPHEDETILSQVQDYINGLKDFVSTAEKVKVRERNEEFEHQIGEKLQGVFDAVYAFDYDGLAKRCADNATDLEFLFYSVMYAYKEKDFGDKSIEKIIMIFTGDNISVDSAKQFDTGFDEPVELEDWEDIPF